MNGSELPDEQPDDEAEEPPGTGSVRALVKDAFTYGAGTALVRFFSFLTLPLFTRAFDPAEYGVLGLALAIQGLLGPLLILGGDSAYARFFFEARTVRAKRLVTSTWIPFLAVWSMGVTLLLLPLSGVMARYLFDDSSRAWVMALALLGCPVTVINRMLGEVLRNQFRATLYSVLSIAVGGATVGCGLVAVFWFDMGVEGVLLGILVGSLLVTPCYLLTTHRAFGRVFSRQVLRNLIRFGGPLIPVSLAYWVFLTSDRIILGKLSSLREVGLYTAANSIIIVMNLGVIALAQAWSPHAVSAYEREPEAAPALYGRVMTYILGAMGILAIAVTAFAPEALRILTTPKFYGADDAVAPLAIGTVAYATTQVTAGGISLKKRTGYLAWHAWEAAILNVLLNIVLVPSYGMMGAAWATAIAYVYLTCAYMWRSHRLWRVSYEVGRSITLAVLIVGFTLVASELPRIDSAATAALKVVFCSSFVGVAFALGAFDRRELHAFRSLLARR